MSRFLNGALSELAPYTPGEQPQDQKYIKLNTNESPFPPSRQLRIPLALESDRLRLYSDPDLRELIRAISREYVVGEDMVFCGNGSDEVLSFAFLAWGADGVTFPDITYGFYPVFAQLYGLDAKIVPLKEDFTIDPDDFCGCGRMTVIANPNAPTGLLLPVDALRRIAESNPGHVLVVDEAYIDFGGETALGLIDEFKNVLIVRTFSKSRQLAGARLGFALGDPALIADLNRIKFSFNPYNVNRLTALAGRIALEDGDWFRWCCKQIVSVRDFVTGELRALGFEVLDSCANFVFARTPRLSGGEYYRKLKEKGILVRHFDKPRIDDFVRITIGTRAQMKALLRKTEEIFKEAGK